MNAQANAEDTPTPGTYGFRYGGVVYHADNKQNLQQMQFQLATDYAYDSVAEFRKLYPIQRVDKTVWSSVVGDFAEERLD